jgi:2-polyprenyl-3-methyl-5-hydroxy-6-metoxy-1,4-benzoquinol methylase
MPTLNLTPTSDRPEYDKFRTMLDERGPLAAGFARQIIETARPFLSKPVDQLDVLDVGSGYGHTALELARLCRHVVGAEPSTHLHEVALTLKASGDVSNCDFRNQGIYELREVGCYDLVVLDNVLEHLCDQPRAVRIIADCLRPAGVAFILVPNKLWPLEVHYRLPFLSYLPLRLANAYLRMTGRGSDYADASYAPTYFGLKRLLASRPDLEYHFTLPANVAWTTGGDAWHYRAGIAMLRRFPFLWAVSKALLVVAVKR